MHPIVEKLAKAGHLTAEQVDRIEKNAQSFVKELQKNPGLRKEAELKLAVSIPAMMGAQTGASAAARAGEGSFGSILEKAWKPTLASMILGTGAVAAEQLGRSAYEAIRGALTKSRDYKNMLEANPDLSGEDSNMVQRAFNTLHKFNPEMAGDPLVAGGFVRSAVQVAQFPVANVRDLISARKDMATIREPKLELHRFVRMPEEQGEPHPAQVEAWRAQAEQARSHAEREHERRLAREKESQVEAE